MFPLLFVEPGVKIDKKYYQDAILERELLPWIKRHYKNKPYVFTQDSAPAHLAKTTQEWCKVNLHSFVTVKEWPASSPDLNPMDYSVWSYLESKACAKPHSSLAALKRSLVKEWAKIDTNYLCAVVDAFPDRLKAVIQAKGGRIEK